MARPLLPIGTAGRFRTRPDGGTWVSRCQFRDSDGVVRQVARWADTKTQAENRLREAIRDRQVDGADISPDTAVPEVAKLYFVELREQVELGTRSGTTVDTYLNRWDKLVEPRVKSFRIRELTTGRVDRILQTINKTHSASTARTCRAVLSGLCGLAVRHGAMKINPIRDARPIEQGKRKKLPRVLETDEALEILDLFDNDPIAVRQDLPDIARWYAGTGNRTGEALALRWEEHVDLTAKVGRVHGNVVWINGQGLKINDGKTLMADRGFSLVDWVVEMLIDRRQRTAARLGVAPEELTGWIFPNSRGGLRQASNLRRDWRAFRDRHNLPDWFTPRTWRLMVGTLLTDHLTGREASDMLGHSKVSFTMDNYVARKMPSRRPAEVLAQVLGRASVTGRDQHKTVSKP